MRQAALEWTTVRHLDTGDRVLVNAVPARLAKIVSITPAPPVAGSRQVEFSKSKRTWSADHEVLREPRGARQPKKGAS